MTVQQRGPRGGWRDITEEERRDLVNLTVGDVPPALSLRARIVLACATGRTQAEVAADLGVHPTTVSKWRTRFETERLDGLLDDPRPGPARSITEAQVDRVVQMTLGERPPGATQWTSRAMAEATGMSQSAIVRIWRDCGLKPWLAGPSLPAQWPPIPRGGEMRGLYIDPPERAMAVVSRPTGDLGAHSSEGSAVGGDLSGDGPANLRGLVEGATGGRDGSRDRRTRASEFKRFLDLLAAEIPQDYDVQVIIDDRGTARTPQIRQWLTRHPRYKTYRAPTSSSWLTTIEKLAGPPAVGSVESTLADWARRTEDTTTPFVWCSTHSTAEAERRLGSRRQESGRSNAGIEPAERPAATRRVIAERALTIIDVDGLAALSMDRLASSLGIRGPSLYHHYADKSEILTEVARLVLLATPVVPEPDPAAWREWQVQQSLGYRRSILAYPNAAPLLLGYRTRELFPDQYERVSNVLLRAGVPYRYHLVVFETTDRFTFGSAMYAARTESAEPEFFPRLDAKATPTLAEAVEVNPWNPEQIFTEALRHFLAQIPDGRKRLR